MKKYLLLPLLLFILLIFVSCVANNSLQNKTSNETTNSTNSIGYSSEEQKLIEYYQSMDAKEIIEDLNKSVEEGVSADGLIYGAKVLAENADTLSDDDIYDYITSDKYSLEVKFVAIEICGYRKDKDTILNQDKYKELLIDNSVENAIKTKLMDYIDFESVDDKAILESIIRGDNEDIIFKTCKTLKSDDFQMAVKIADEIIEDYKNASIQQMRGAAIIKCDDIKNQIKDGKNDTDEYKAQIAALKEMCFYGFENTDDSATKDSLILDLAGTLDLNALGDIISYDEIDDQLKQMCVGNNYPTFVRILQNDLSEDEIDIVIDALNIRPIKQTYDLLKNNITPKNEEQQARLNALLKKIETQGVEGKENLLNNYYPS